MKLKFNNSILSVLVVAIASCLVTACQSTGDELKGTWKGAIPTSYEDGTRTTENVYFKFIPDGDFFATEGEYIDMRSCFIKDDEDVTLPMVYKCVYYIKGRWTVDDEKNLYTEPDVSTLRVKIMTQDFKIKYHGKWHTLEEMRSDYENGDIGLSTEELISEIRNDTKTNLTKSYNEDKEKASKESFGVTIDGDNLSLQTSDVGTLKFERSTQDLMDIFNSDEDI